MPLYRDEAIALRYFDFGEADRIVSLFARRHGKIRVLAKGAKKLKSRFAGRLEPFHTVELVFYGKEHASLFKLSSIEIATARRSFSTNLDRFLRACYVAEMVESGLRDHDPNPQAFDTVTAALSWMANETKPQILDWIVRFFDVKFLGDVGYRPTMDRCVSCRNSLSLDRTVAFDAHRGGMLCHRCKRSGAISLSIGSARFLEKMVSTGFDRAGRFRPSPAIMGEITRSITAFRDSRIHANLRSERFFAYGNAILSQ